MKVGGRKMNQFMDIGSRERCFLNIIINLFGKKYIFMSDGNMKENLEISTEEAQICAQVKLNMQLGNIATLHQCNIATLQHYNFEKH